MEEILKELVTELKVQNKLIALFYTHKATDWDGCDNPIDLYQQEQSKALEILAKIKSNLR